MDNYYDRMVENLGKLQRNETQMTPEQKEKYKKPLRKLKQEIADDATQMMRDFIYGGIRIPIEDKTGAEAFKKVRDEILEQDAKKVSKEASRALFKTYDLDKFMEALLPIHYRLWYEAYGPVWLSHCKATGDPEYPYHNDIIGMDWDQKSSVWFNREKVSWTLMLPPTKELLEAAYQSDMECGP